MESHFPCDEISPFEGGQLKIKIIDPKPVCNQGSDCHQVLVNPGQTISGIVTLNLTKTY